MKYKNTEIVFLKKNYKLGVAFCADKLDRTKSSIRSKLYTLGIGRKTKREVKTWINFKFFNRPNKESAYFLGILWGDGYIVSRGYSQDLCIEMVTEDANSLLDIINISGDWNILRRKRGNWKEITKYTLHSQKLVEFLIEHGFNQDKNPELILSLIPKKFHRYFWLGFLDADGSVSYRPRQKNPFISFSGSYTQTWLELQKFCELHNIIGRICLSKYKTKTGKIHKCSKFYFSKKSENLKFGQILFQDYHNNTFGLKRKYDKFIEYKES